jgi:UDP-N-acetylglucosamine 2-epimerase
MIPAPKPLTVITLVGTRPEIIRLSEVIRLLDRTCRHLIVHTGQNSDYELNEIFFEELGLRRPDHYLGVETRSIGGMLGQLMPSFEAVIEREKPDAVLILGDTNSSLAAIVAKRLGITVFHMEAGNRCFDLRVPEEINRRLIDHISDFNLVYTEHARRNLLREGLEPRHIYLTGSPLKEVLEVQRPRIMASTVLSDLGLAEGGYLLASLHRAETVDHPDRLIGVLDALHAVGDRLGLPIVASTHPRTRNRLASHSADRWPRIAFHKPFGFLAWCRLQQAARCVISDSGTISEEAAILQFPAITPREAMERPEAMDAGTIVLTGLDPATISAAVDLAIAQHAGAASRPIPAEYAIPNTAERVVRLIVGTARLAHRWRGEAAPDGSPVR